MRCLARSLSGLLVLLAGAGCGGSGGGGNASVGGSAGTTATGPLEVVRAEPAHGSQPSAVSVVRLVFNRGVDPATAILDAANTGRSTIFLAEQAPTASVASLLAAQVAVRGPEITLTPSRALVAGDRYGVALTSGLRDAGGTALAAGSVSGPVTLGVPGLVFQASFTLAAATSGGTGSGTGTGTGAGTTAATPAGLLASFAIEPASDPWTIDFTTVGTIDADLRQRGLGAGDPAIDAWTRGRVIQRVLAYAGNKYFRRDDGSGVRGQSYAISFVPSAPAGRAGVDFSRHCVGDRGSGGTLGESLYDPGNRDKEDNSPANGCGVYSSSIDGTKSTLRTPIRTGELRFVDGTYRLGQQTAADDARFLAIQDALLDYGMAIGVVLAHEVGHSVGLDHDRAGPTSIMSAAISAQMMSNPNMQFSTTSRPLLDQNLGYTR